MSRIVIIGSGHVGAHCAYALTLSGVADEIVLLDIDRKKAAAQALDLADAAALLPHGTRVWDGWYEDCKNADIVVLAAGAPRIMEKNALGETVAPSRLSLLGESVRMLKDIIPRLSHSHFDGVLISITNPCDVIAQCLGAHVSLPKERIFGTGTGLDTARLAARLGASLHLPAQELSCLVMGEHGDTQIAPRSQARICDRLPEQAVFDTAAAEARTGGAVIINGKGSTEFGIGTVLMRTARAVLNDEKAVLPVSTYLSGQFGQSGVYAGVSAVIGHGGVERIIEPVLSSEELDGFARSCDTIRSYAARAEELYCAEGAKL